MRGGPVTLTASVAAAVESLNLTPDQAHRDAANARRRRRTQGARTATGYVKPRNDQPGRYGRPRFAAPGGIVT